LWDNSALIRSKHEGHRDSGLLSILRAGSRQPLHLGKDTLLAIPVLSRCRPPSRFVICSSGLTINWNTSFFPRPSFLRTFRPKSAQIFLQYYEEPPLLTCFPGRSTSSNEMAPLSLSRRFHFLLHEPVFEEAVASRRYTGRSRGPHLRASHGVIGHPWGGEGAVLMVSAPALVADLGVTAMKALV